MNILILGTGEIEQTLIKLCQKSKLLDKIYTASNEPLDDIANIDSIKNPYEGMLFFSRAQDSFYAVKSISCDGIKIIDYERLDLSQFTWNEF